MTDRIGELMALVDRYATPLHTNTTAEEEAADAHFDGLRGRIESAARALAGEAATPQEPGAREAFEAKWGKSLDLTMTEDAWGRPIYLHPHVQSIWLGWESHALAAGAGEPVSADGSLTLEAALAGVLNLYPGANKQALRRLGELLTKPVTATPVAWIDPLHLAEMQERAESTGVWQSVIARTAQVSPDLIPLYASRSPHVLTDELLYEIAKRHEGEYGTDMLGYGREVAALYADPTGVAAEPEPHTGADDEVKFWRETAEHAQRLANKEATAAAYLKSAQPVPTHVEHLVWRACVQASLPVDLRDLVCRRFAAIAAIPQGEPKP